MKSWKEWPYWGRGALIGVVICLFFILFQTVIAPHYFYGVCDGVFCLSPFASNVQAVFNTTLIPLYSSLAGDFFLESPTWLLVAALIYYFFIGAFIGLLYGKIRHGKDTIHPPKN